MCTIVNILLRMTELEKIGVVLRKKRYACRMTQEDLAGATEIERSYISQIENGRRSPSLAYFLRICQALEAEPWAVLKEALTVHV